MSDSAETWWSNERNEKVWPFRIIVMRHARHSNGTVTAKGLMQIGDVAQALAEWSHFKGVAVATFHAFPLANERDEVFGEEVAETKALMEHHYTLARRRAGPRRRGHRATDLGLVRTYLPDSEELKAGEAETENPKDNEETENPTKKKEQKKWGLEPRLVVLNEPQAGQFIKRLSGASIELRHSELVLLERVPHWGRARGWRPWRRYRYRAVWTMAPRVPKGDPLLAEVREKVASKMRTAAALGALITSLLTFILTRLFTDTIAWGNATFLSLVAFAVSAIWFFVAMFFYDTLTMPQQFWGGGQGAQVARAGSHEKKRDWYWSASKGWLLERPPSATSRIVQLNMVRIWSYVFRPAIVMLGIGVAFLLVALDDPTAPGPTTTIGTSTTAGTATSATTTATTTGHAGETSETRSSAPAPTDAAATGTSDPPADGEQDAPVDLKLWHAIALLATAAAVVGWSVWFRPRTGASD